MPDGKPRADAPRGASRRDEAPREQVYRGDVVRVEGVAQAEGVREEGGGGEGGVCGEDGEREEPGGDVCED